MNYGVHSHKIFHLPDLPVLKTKVKYGKIEMLNEFVSIAPLHRAAPLCQVEADEGKLTIQVDSEGMLQRVSSSESGS